MRNIKSAIQTILEQDDSVPQAKRRLRPCAPLTKIAQEAIANNMFRGDGSHDSLNNALLQSVQTAVRKKIPVYIYNAGNNEHTNWASMIHFEYSGVQNSRFTPFVVRPDGTVYAIISPGSDQFEVKV